MSFPTVDSTNDQGVPADAGIDLPAALDRLGGDAELLREMAQIVVQDMPEILLRAQSGLQSGDHEAATIAAHSLKGLASNFSAAAARAAQETESAFREGNVEQARSTLRVLEAFVEKLTAELRRTVIDG